MVCLQPKLAYVGDDVADIRAMMEVGLPWHVRPTPVPDVKAVPAISPVEGATAPDATFLSRYSAQRPLDVRR